MARRPRKITKAIEKLLDDDDFKSLLEIQDEEVLIQSLIDLKISKCFSKSMLVEFLIKQMHKTRKQAYDLIKIVDDEVIKLYNKNNRRTIEMAIADFEAQRYIAASRNQLQLVYMITIALNQMYGLNDIRSIIETEATEVTTVELLLPPEKNNPIGENNTDQGDNRLQKES